MYDKWCKVLDTVPEREQKLADEMERQQANEELRVAFAEKANSLAEYISQRQGELAEQSMKALGTMEVYITSLFFLFYFLAASCPFNYPVALWNSMICHPSLCGMM